MKGFRGRRRKFKLRLKPTTVYTFSTVGLCAVGGLIMLSFLQQGQLLTSLFAILTHWFGWGTVLLPFIFISAGLMLSRMTVWLTKPNIFIGSSLLMVALVSLTQAGVLGKEVWQSFSLLISGPGTGIVFMALSIIALVILFDTSLEELSQLLAKFFSRFKKAKEVFQKTADKPMVITHEPMKIHTNEPVITPKLKTEADLTGEIVTNLPVKGQVWKLPPLSLLSDNLSGKADRGDIKKNAETIEKTLESFGISARVAEVNLGPAVTQYALEIALGTKLSKITALSTDLAMALAAPTGQIRIEAPIPGRSLAGVEVPNHSLEIVSLKQLLSSEEMKKAKSKLTVALGLNVSGKSVVADIGKMPHVLIAGSTGSGKSVCIHSIITTILFRASPSEVKFILVDPKRVELTLYNGIPHLLTPVIVEPDKVVSALKWAIGEMDRRYKLFAEVGARNIDNYNEQSGFVALPYIVIIIDELADIILFAPAEVEDNICRIAQMARATGIHLIISTQRPSVDVLTGLIKANIPARIAFNVSSQIDSRVILDTPGAEKLLGRGDMLFIPPDQAKPSRIQGTYVTDGDLQKLIEFMKQSGLPPEYAEEVIQMPPGEVRFSPSTSSGGEEKDPLFDESVGIITQYDRASASLLQRRLKVGYARAARILDQMEKVNIVGPAEGAKAREVYLQNAKTYLETPK